MTPLELARAFLQKGDEDKVLLSKLVTATEVSESISDFKYSKPPRSTSRQSSQWDASRPTRAHDQNPGWFTEPQRREIARIAIKAIRNEWFILDQPVIEAKERRVRNEDI